ncbi:hypothetical protein DBV15_11962, partial [Temnothorax longispinosus]
MNIFNGDFQGIIWQRCKLCAHVTLQFITYGLLSTFIFTNCPLFFPTLLLTLCFLSLIIIIKSLFDKKKISQYSLIIKIDTLTFLLSTLHFTIGALKSAALPYCS